MGVALMGVVLMLLYRALEVLKPVWGKVTLRTVEWSQPLHFEDLFSILERVLVLLLQLVLHLHTLSETERLIATVLLDPLHTSSPIRTQCYMYFLAAKNQLRHRPLPPLNNILT